MSKAHLYALDPIGNWVPVRVDQVGELVGGGGGGGAGSIPASSNPQIVQPWSYAAESGGITDDSDVTLASAPGAGKSVYLVSLQAINTDDTTGTEVVVKSGSTVLWRLYLPAEMTYPANVTFERPLIAANNTALTVACITSGATVYVNAQGFVEKAIDLIQADQTTELELTDGLGNLLVDGAGNQLIVPNYL